MKSEENIQPNETCFSVFLANYLDQKGDNGVALLEYVGRYIAHVSRAYYEFSWSEQEDIRQEIAVLLLCNGEKYRQTFTKRLLYVMVRNQCLDQLRKKNRQLAAFAPHASTEDQQSSAPPTVADGADAELFHHLNCLEQIFGKIKSQQTGEEDVRIYTQYAFGLSHLEISRTSNRSVTAIARRLSILRSRLKKLRTELC